MSFVSNRAIEKKGGSYKEMPHSSKLCRHDILFKEGGGAVHTRVLSHRFIPNTGNGILTVQFPRSTGVMAPRPCSSTHARARTGKEGKPERKEDKAQEGP